MPERIDPLRHAGLGQSYADEATRAFKFYVFRQGHGRGDNFRLASIAEAAERALYRPFVAW